MLKVVKRAPRDPEKLSCDYEDAGQVSEAATAIVPRNSTIPAGNS
jgi:hypothetical protein